MNISVFGLGYVGIVSSACLAKIGHNVIGVDIIDYKIESLNNGISHIEEKDLNELVSEQVSKKKLSATKNAEEAILKTDITFVCVGTPPKENGDMDFSAIEKSCSEIGRALRKKKSHIIVIRSTMFPGSFERVKDIIEKSSGKKYGKDFYLATNPEFLREGTAIKDFFNPPYIIIGSEDKQIGEKVMRVYGEIKTKRFIVHPNIAQMIKYASNSFHALKVSFANEIGAVCSKMNIDSKELMNLFCEDNQLNISSYYLKPGFAYGGSCLPKDLAALKNSAAKLGIDCPVLSSISKSNLKHIERAVELIKSTGKKKIGILGLAFKPDTDDIRGNPILFVINKLLDVGYEIKIFDRIINESDIEAINESYRKEVYDLVNMENLKEKVGSISSLFSDMNSVLKQDIILISNRDPSLKDCLKSLSKNQIFIDLQNIYNKDDTNAQYMRLV
jgi:GDP-mannose 6-dehydrogenase